VFDVCFWVFVSGVCVVPAFKFNNYSYHQLSKFLFSDTNLNFPFIHVFQSGLPPGVSVVYLVSWLQRTLKQYQVTSIINFNLFWKRTAALSVCLKVKALLFLEILWTWEFTRDY